MLKQTATVEYAYCLHVETLLGDHITTYDCINLLYKL